MKKLILLMILPIILNGVAAWYLIPFFNQNNGLPIEVSYFIGVGIFVFIPMILMVLFFVKEEEKSYETIMKRLRIFQLSKSDWKTIFIAMAIISVSSLVISEYILPILGLAPKPFFFQNMPFASNMRWIIIAWLFYFILNIVGEECYWRGYILPRQESFTGKFTWLIQGLMWAIWHLPLGLNVVISSLPVLILLPYFVQKKGNTGIGIVVHAFLGAFGFLVLAFGLIK